MNNAEVEPTLAGLTEEGIGLRVRDDPGLSMTIISVAVSPEFMRRVRRPIWERMVDRFLSNARDELMAAFDVMQEQEKP